MRKHLIAVSTLIFLCTASMACALPNEMQSLKAYCEATLIKNPTLEDIKKAAFCEGFIRAHAEMTACQPNPQLTMEEFIGTFIKVLADPKKYGLDSQNLSSRDTTNILMKSEFCQIDVPAPPPAPPSR